MSTQNFTDGSEFWRSHTASSAWTDVLRDCLRSFLRWLMEPIDFPGKTWQSRFPIPADTAPDSLERRCHDQEN